MIAHSLTAVQPYTKIRRERRLPQAGEVVVTLGEQVNPVQVVARTTQQRGYAIVPAAEILGVPAEEVSRYLLVEEGTAVQRNKPLLRKRGMFRTTEYVSPVNGMLHQVNNGRLVLQQTPDLLEVRAMIQGIVAGNVGGRGVVIETYGTLIQGVWGNRREGYGTIKVVAERSDVALAREHIGADVRGTILVAGLLQQTGVLDRAEANSVRGVIVGSVPARLSAALADYRFPVIVTEGFCGQQMCAPIFDLLHQMQGREASLLGAPANAWTRPEIIIPVPGRREKPATLASESPDALQLGQRVRILGDPYAGKVGEVIALHRRARTTELGYCLSGADVAIADDQVIFVPYSNLDMIR